MAGVKDGSVIERIAIVGAGTMGAGIALSALYADLEVGVYDVSEQVLEQAERYLDKYLAKKGLTSRKHQLELTSQLSDLAVCQLWIEAVPESLDLKRQVFDQIEAVCDPGAVLATNTSTLSVAAIAERMATPGRLIGLHFFNPAAVMPLVEIVTTESTPPEVRRLAEAFVTRLDKTGVLVKDSPGFIVNRVARPYYAEALRLLGESVADHVLIDQLLQAVGFRMGPFRLMDLIGIDVNLAAVRSMYEQTGGEPRYQPHPIQRELVEAGRLGRKSGRGFYAYPDETGPQPNDAPAEVSFRGAVYAVGGSLAPGVLPRLQSAGFEVAPRPELAQLALLAPAADTAGDEALALVEAALPPQAPVLVQTVTRTQAGWARHSPHPERLVGIDTLFLARADQVAVCAAATAPERVRAQTTAFLNRLGKSPRWVADSPAMVVPRVVCQLVNEAAFAVDEAVADADTIDTAMRLGANYPMGPLEWADELGVETVAAVIDHLHQEFDEPRYRMAPWLRQQKQLHSTA